MDLQSLLPVIYSMTWQNLVMIAVGLTLSIYLAIAKEYEPNLLLPMGFGAVLVNIPFTSALTQIDPVTGKALEGALSVFYEAGIANEVFPLLIFIAIGAMIDFSPLFKNPLLLLFGAAAVWNISDYDGCYIAGIRLKRSGFYWYHRCSRLAHIHFCLGGFAPDLLGLFLLPLILIWLWCQ